MVLLISMYNWKKNWQNLSIKTMHYAFLLDSSLIPEYLPLSVVEKTISFAMNATMPVSSTDEGCRSPSN